MLLYVHTVVILQKKVTIIHWCTWERLVILCHPELVQREHQHLTKAIAEADNSDILDNSTPHQHKQRVKLIYFSEVLTSDEIVARVESQVTKNSTPKSQESDDDNDDDDDVFNDVFSCHDEGKHLWYRPEAKLHTHGQLSLHTSETWQLSCRGSITYMSLLTYTCAAE